MACTCETPAVTAAEEAEPEAPPPDEATTDELPARWHAVLVLENTWTTDGRRFAPESLSARPLPLPLRLMVEDSHGGLPENRVVLCGSIDTITREGDRILGEGTFDLNSDDGREAARLVSERLLRWVSVEIEPLEYEITFPEIDMPDDAGDEVVIDEQGDPLFEVQKGNIMGASIVPIPAFPQAVIAPEGVPLADAATAGEDAAVGIGIASPAPEEESLAAAGGPLTPPAAWFADPQLDGPTPLTIDDDGRVLGHAATWGTCHTGRTDACLTAPHSASGYRYLTTGSVAASVGDKTTPIPVGQITMATGHAPLSARHHAASAHYDDTGTAVADIAAGEDAHGIWVAGALRPDVSAEQVRTLRAAALSGDWRSIGGSLELVALLAVNVPGFPVVRASAGVNANDGQLSLVAAGLVDNDRVEDQIRRIVGEELAPLRAQLALLREPMIAALDDRMHVEV